MDFKVGQYIKVHTMIYYVEEIKECYLKVRNDKENFTLIKHRHNVIVDEEIKMLDIIKQREDKLKRIMK